MPSRGKTPAILPDDNPGFRMLLICSHYKRDFDDEREWGNIWFREHSQAADVYVMCFTIYYGI